MASPVTPGNRLYYLVLFTKILTSDQSTSALDISPEMKRTYRALKETESAYLTAKAEIDRIKHETDAFRAIYDEVVGPFEARIEELENQI